MFTPMEGNNMNNIDTFFCMVLGVLLMFASIVSAMSYEPPFWGIILGAAGVVVFVMPMITTTLEG